MTSDKVRRLIEQLQGPGKVLRITAASALGLTRDTDAVEPLLHVLAYDDDQLDLANVALLALKRLGDFSYGPLIRALQEGDDVMRQHAALALGHLYNPLAVGPLLIALNDPAEQVRYSVIGALEQIGDARAISALERFANEDESKTKWGTSLAEEARKAVERIRRNEENKGAG